MFENTVEVNSSAELDFQKGEDINNDDETSAE